MMRGCLRQQANSDRNSEHISLVRKLSWLSKAPRWIAERANWRIIWPTSPIENASSNGSSRHSSSRRRTSAEEELLMLGAEQSITARCAASLSLEPRNARYFAESAR